MFLVPFSEMVRIRFLKNYNVTFPPALVRKGWRTKIKKSAACLCIVVFKNFILSPFGS